MKSNGDEISSSAWKDVSIPGFVNVVDAKAKPHKRIIWGLAIAFCLAICISQISERVRFFLYSSVAVKVSIVDERSPPMPRITICSGLNNLNAILDCDPKYSPIQMSRSEFTNVWQRSECGYVDILNLTSEQVWAKREISLDTTEIHIKTSTDDNWRPVDFAYTRHVANSGPCVTFTLSTHLKNENMLGGRIKIHVEDLFHSTCTDALGDYSVFYHEDEQPLIPEVTKEDVYNSAFTTFSSVQVSQFINLNTIQSPCVSKKKYYACRKKCLKKELTSARVSCHFPLSVDAHVKRNECAKFDECTVGLRELRSVLNFHDPNKCECPRKCDSVVYAATTAPGPLRGENIAELIVVLPRSYRKVEEFVAYNVVALFCDIGGSLGLCLGLCLISLMELVQTVVSSVKSFLA